MRISFSDFCPVVKLSVLHWLLLFRALRDHLVTTSCGTTTTSWPTSCRSSLTSCATLTPDAPDLSPFPRLRTTLTWWLFAPDTISSTKTTIGRSSCEWPHKCIWALDVCSEETTSCILQIWIAVNFAVITWGLTSIIYSCHGLIEPTASNLVKPSFCFPLNEVLKVNIAWECVFANLFAYPALFRHSGEGSLHSGSSRYDQESQLQAMSKAIVVHQNTVRNMYFTWTRGCVAGEVRSWAFQVHTASRNSQRDPVGFAPPVMMSAACLSVGPAQRYRRNDKAVCKRMEVLNLLTNLRSLPTTQMLVRSCSIVIQRTGTNLNLYKGCEVSENSQSLKNHRTCGMRQNGRLFAGGTLCGGMTV